MPACNAAKTLHRTYDEVTAQGIVDQIILADDSSSDETAAIAATLNNVYLHVHPENRGYGENQKTCYRIAFGKRSGHHHHGSSDYQYTPFLIPAMASLVSNGLYSCVLGSRIPGGGALKSGMPWWKYIANRRSELSNQIFC